MRYGGLPIRPGLPPTGTFHSAPIGFTNFDRLLGKITLPDSRNYQFQYTAYGELARLILPTGGAVEYDHGAGLANAGSVAGGYADGSVMDNPGTFFNTTDPDPGWRPTIYRRVLKRRTYPDGGTGTGSESETTYSLRESGSDPDIWDGKVTTMKIAASPYLEESTTGAGLSASIVTRHYFFESADAPFPEWSSWNAASPLQSMMLNSGKVRMPNDNNVAEGVEYKTTMPGLHSTEKGFVLATDASRALRVCQETVLAGDSANKRAETLLFYDARGNVTDTYAYGYGDGPALNRTNGVPRSCGTLSVENTYQRRTTVAYKTDAAYVADSRHLLRLPVSEETFGPGAAQVSSTVYDYDLRALLPAELTPVAGHDAAVYPSARTERGNVTGIRRSRSSGSVLTTAYQYDVLGNARYVMTPNLVQNWVSFSSTASIDAEAANAGKWSYADGWEASGGSGKALAFVTGEQLPGAVSVTNRFSASTTYDNWLGQPSGFTDINGVSTSFGYGSAGSNLDQLTALTRAVGTGAEAKTSYDYGFGGPSPYVAVSGALRSATDGLLRTKSVFDGFGREVENWQHNGTAWVITKKVYDGAHRLWRVYNPTTGTPTVLTETTYDGLGRPVLVTAPGGAKTTYLYSENETTVTDPANVKKKLVTDALGRLVSVTEDPGGLGLETKYFYSATGNLLTVCPSGGSLSTAGVCTGTGLARTFTYDWLGRLLTVTNPESSTISYGYDDPGSTNGMGNLTTKTQLRGDVGSPVTVTTRFHYDNLGRMTSKVYTGAPDGVATPGVSYSYDAHNPAIAGVTSYAKGRRTRVEVSGGVATTVDSYDAMGRATRSSQGTYRFGADGIAGYEYLRNGAVSVMRLPTGRTLSYAYDDGGRPVGVGDGATAYVSAVGYKDFGAMETLRMNGNLLRETRSYDGSRLQLTGIALERCTDGTTLCSVPAAVRSFGYTYTNGTGNGSGPNNNGSVRTQTIADPGAAAATQVYGYDALDRLTSFVEGGLNETYCYDAHGNRAVLQRVGLSPLIPQVTTCTPAAVAGLFPGNRWAMTAYDAAGGIRNDGRSNLRYDAEDRLVKTWPAGGSTETLYSYDGDGKRVTAGGVTFVYDVFGKLAVEYGGTVTASGREFMGVDHLGSTRAAVSTDAVRRMDYWPFGMELSVVDTAWRTGALGFAVDAKSRLKFTGKERDAETGLDYFGARYFSGAQGRFTSVDPLFFQAAMPLDPQRFNLYSYARNNPLKFIDPTGREIELIGSEEQRKKTFELLQRGVGERAGKLLTVTEKKGFLGLGKTRYVVDIAKGKTSEFASANAATADVSKIIQNSKTVQVGIAGGNETLNAVGGKTTLNQEKFNGITGFFDGVVGALGSDLRSYIKDPGEGSYGRVPGFKMEDGRSAEANPMFTLFHELGHAVAAMQGLPNEQIIQGALDLENKVRKVQSPKAADRTIH